MAGQKAIKFDAEVKFQQIFYGMDKINVEKFYTRCRNILHITSRALSFWSNFRGIQGIGGPKVSNNIMEPLL